MFGSGVVLSCAGCRLGNTGANMASGHLCILLCLLPVALSSSEKITPDNASLFVLEELNLNFQRNSMKLHNRQHKAHEPKVHMPSHQNKIHLFKTQVLETGRKFL